MRKLLTSVAVASFVVMFSTVSYANPLAVAAGAESLAAAGAVAGGGDATAVAGGGKGTGVGIGGGGTGVGGGGTGTSGSSSDTGDNTTIAGALGQAMSALSVGGICGKDSKFAFGLVQWSDYSSKCFNYTIAIEIARDHSIPVAERFDLVNMWVERADSM